MDTGRLRLRLSVFCRAVFALGILLSFTLVVVAAVTLLGLLFAAVLVLGVDIVGTTLTDYAPRLSTVLALSPALVAISSFVGFIVVLWLGSRFTGDRSDEEVTVVSIVFAVLTLGSLYTFVVETAVVLGRSSLWPALTSRNTGIVIALIVMLTVSGAVSEARSELGRIRDQLVDDSESATESHPALAETTTRLAAQADIPSPTLRITSSDRPESFALGTAGDAVIVVSTGLVSALSEAEATAVLAHEISHLANADHRVMDAVLVPVLMADELIESNPGSLIGYVENAVMWLLKLYGQYGVAILARGREWSADAGAVALTGSPAALASALSTLSERRQTPSTDLREWEQSVSALDILPPSDREHATGPFRTHPSTEKRIDRLRQQVVDVEQTSA